MNASDIVEYLSRAANQMTGHASPPVRVLPLCRQLGIAVKRSSEITSGARLRSSERGRTILLPERQDGANGINPADRFNIAHEIGHSVLDEARLCMPIGQSEYWQHEALCHAFAGRLLCPDRAVVAALGRSPLKARDFLQASIGMSFHWHVPWATVAYRITDCFPHAAFFRFIVRQDHLWLQLSTLRPRDRLKNSKLRTEKPLCLKLLDLRTGAHSVPATLNEALVDEYAANPPARSAVAFRPQEEKIYMAVVGDRRPRSMLLLSTELAG
jgi:hypothetical protein